MPAPLIVQQDGTLLLATGAPGARGVAEELARFAELDRCPGEYHHYRLTRHTLWDAAAAGLTVERVVGVLRDAAGGALPVGVARGIARTMGRYGRLRLARDADGLWLRGDDPALVATLTAKLGAGHVVAGRGLPVAEGARGRLKGRLAALGWPVRDEAGYRDGEALAIAWRPAIALRDYQREALAAFADEERGRGGSGLVLLPCGAGKTLVGVGATVALGCRTLVLCPNALSAGQWVAAYREFTDLPPEAVGEYGPRRREVRPVTVTTYQMLTARRAVGRGTAPVEPEPHDGIPASSAPHAPRPAAHPHLDLVGHEAWGLLVFDEAHLLPADVFRLTAQVQSRRRLGLTATPVREDGREAELFTLVGPVLYCAAWGQLAREGWIAPVECVEVRVPPAFGRDRQGVPVAADLTHRAATSVATKWPVVRALARRHRGEGVLVIGHYLDQLRDLAARLGAPLVAGGTPRAERERLFDRFRSGDEPVLVLSRVGNAALDLPNAAVAIEVSGNFGSRQEEAQRLGRILRPKGGRTAYFYALVTDGSVERDHAARRQRFLVEQGYRYRIVAARALLAGSAVPGATPPGELGSP